MKTHSRRVGQYILVALVIVGGSGLMVRGQSPQAIGTWVPSGAIADSRVNAASTTLADGHTLIAGGYIDGSPSASIVVYNPLDHSFAAAGAMSVARVGHTATALDDGRVLIAGGLANGLATADLEIFNPADGSSAMVGTMNAARSGHAAALLPDGTVLLVGGSDGSVAQASGEIFHADSMATTSINPMSVGRAGLSATTLIDGRVLVAGGNNGTVDLATAEIFNPWAESFEPVSTALSVARSGHAAVLLPHNAGVLIAGGSSNGVPQMASDLFLAAIFDDPYAYAQGQFVPTGALVAPRSGAVSGPAGDNGYAFVAGGATVAEGGAAAVAANAEAYRFATIKTDKDDYAPGEPAVITGAGWQPGEEVTLLFQEDPAMHDDYLLTVTADSEGNVYWDQWAPEAHDVGVRFYLTAQDSHSRAQITFTDASSFAVTVSPSTVTASSTNDFVFSFMSTNGSSNPNIAITIPAGWTAPQSVAGPGQVTVVSGTCTTVSLVSVNSGSRVITIGQGAGCANNRTFTVNYQGATAPATAQAYTFATTLTGTSPVVTVIGNTVGTVAVGAQTGALTYGVAGSASYTVTVNRNGATGTAFSANLSVSSALPAGVAASFSPASVSFAATDTSKTSTLTMSTTTATPAAVTSFAVQAANPAIPGDLSTGTGTLTVGKKNVTPNITAQNKVYDGTTTATLATQTLAGVLAGDAGNVTLNVGAANFDTRNVGAGKTVTTTGLTLSGSAASNYQLSSTTATATANITARPLTITAITDSKVYDGTGASTATPTVSGLQAGDSVTGLTQAFDGKNVGARTLSVTASTVNDGNGGANYAVTTQTATGTITPRSLTVTATGVNRIYDGTTAATVTLSDNRVAGDVFTASYTTATFYDKNVGTAKTVSVSGISITGTDATNYTLSNTTAAATANITPRTLNVTATGINKIYDGNTTATVNLSTDKVSGDDVTAAYTSASFPDKNAGAGKPVSVTGISISGGDAGNYTLANTSASATADITPRTLNVTATGSNKIYDGNSTATVNVSTDKVSGDAVSAAYTSASFADKNVGTGKPVSVNGISIAGADAGNYTLASTTGATSADITPRNLVVTATGVNKVYDGNTTATVTLTTDKVSGDDVTASSSSAAFADKNVGTGKTVNVAGISISGGDAGNYTLTNTTATTAADITSRTLAVTAAGVDKVFNGTTVATVTLSDNRVAGDILTTAHASADFADANVGTGKTVSVSGISVTGVDAGNYTFNTSATATASITAAPVTATAGSGSAAYDGLAQTPAACAVTGTFTGDLTCANNPASVGPAAGTYPIAPVVSGTGLSNFDITSVSGSYTINQASSTTTITCPASVVYNGSAQTPCTATVTGAGGLNQAVPVTYTDNLVGTATASATFAGDTNHTGSSDSKTFLITTAPVTATAGSGSATYDGLAQTPGACAVSGSYTGDLTCANSPASVGPAAGSSPIAPVVSGTTLSNFAITSVNGSYTISQASSTTTITCPAGVVYNGVAQAVCTATVTGAGSLNQAVPVTYSDNTSVGTATASATFAGDANHTGSSDSKTFAITAAPVTATAGGGTATFDGSAKTPAACVVAGTYTGDLTCANNPSSVGPAAGTYPIAPVVSGTNQTNFAITSVNGSYTISQASSTTTITCPVSVVYTGVAQEVCTATVTGAGSLNQAVPVTYTDNVNVGTATASATFAGDANHTGSSDSKTFAITQAPVTATAGSGSATYDGLTQTPAACVVSGSYTGDLTCANNPSSVGPAAGTYPIAPVVSGTNQTNFAITSVNGSYTISPASSTTTITCPVSVVYTGVAQEVCTATVTGAGSLNQAVPVTYTDNVNVGTATASATFAGDANHTGSSDSKTFLITQAPVTATAGGGTATFDGSAKTPAACVVSGTYTGDLSCANSPATVGAAAGTYPIAPVVSGAGQTNFAITSVNGSYTISQASSTTTITCPASVVYNGAAQEVCTATVTGAGGLNQAVPVTYSDNVTVGTATASATFAGDANHTGSSDSETFAITAAPVTATAGGGTATFDGSAKTPAACVVAGTYTGDLTCANNPSSVGPAAGTYPIAPVVSGTGQSNFAITSVNGSYTISPASSTTTITCPASVVYNGAAQAVCTATVTGAGGLNLSPTPLYANNVNAGTATANYTYTADPNHTGSSDSRDFTIAKLALAVNADNKSKTYGAANPGLTASAPGLATGDTLDSLGLGFTLSTTATMTSGVANYPIAFSGGPAATSNYGPVTYANGTLAITPKALTVTAESKSRVYGDPNPTLTGAATGLVGADTLGALALGYTLSTTALQSSNVASYPISFSSGATSTANYNPITYVSGTIAITTATLTVTSNNGARAYGVANPAFSGVIAGIRNSDSITATHASAAVTATPVGVYGPPSPLAIMATLADPGSKLGNYSLTKTEGTLTIGAWNATGFYQPVGVPNSIATGPGVPLPMPVVGTLWNTIKGGQGVPLKFELFTSAGGTELTTVSSVQGFLLSQVACSPGIDDTVETFTTNGGTTLRYDSGDGQYVQNWDTPKGAGKCYRVAMTAIDGSSISAFFKTK